MTAQVSLGVVAKFSFLAPFRVADGVYDLGGRLFPGSIRDQIIRARLFAEHLAKLIVSPNDKEKNICVIGAGPAGMTVSMRLSRLPDIKVWLVDQNPKPLSLLGGVTDRVISPTLYDWPATHSSCLRFVGEPLYEEKRPYEIRDQWLREFESAEKTGNIVWCGSTMANALLTKGGPPWGVRVSPSQRSSEKFTTPNFPDKFDVVLLCRGFGKEHHLKAYRRVTENDAQIPVNNEGRLLPFPFWEADPYPVAGKRRLPPTDEEDLHCAVAIIGDGDGAIQDLLRFVTGGLNARDLLNAIGPVMPSIRDADLRFLLSHVDNLARFEALAATSVQLRADLHSCISRAAQSVPSGHLKDCFQPLVEFHSVRLCFRNPQIDPRYPLNHFLALLLRRYIQENEGVEIFLPNHDVEAVECEHPWSADSNSNPLAHFNQIHRLRFKATYPVSSLRCRVVVPRMGIDPASVQCNRVLHSVSHALPHWLPDWKPE